MVDFSSKNEGRMFYFNDDDHEQGGVGLRELGIEEGKRIEKLTVKHKRKPRAGRMQETTDVDAKTASHMTWDYCITEWKGVLLDGKELECTGENKQLMMKCTDFCKFVTDCIEELVSVNDTLEGARSKNSESSSSGS